ncbi:hypothetical protein RIR_e71952_A0A2I1EKS6_9GLOM [Rhizophagus irregularis DAOM 181602=DAOM 197198]|uniref:Uncharacterized protein n=1 Tax=Rhizophagus irregularis (strain DAOM 181602 / DAOM 197198 / MUCL 43194) TaxID=747089 RepID=U9U6X5_RHIID|nr:hypothetical protein RIR_e71952_A0A2I1EKS6_9GLOM [Rhizophagus irregularis DAOM 181602=DAOM 197198]
MFKKFHVTKPNRTGFMKSEVTFFSLMIYLKTLIKSIYGYTPMIIMLTHFFMA